MGFLYYLLLGTLMIFVLVVTCVVKIKENERGVKFRSGEFKCVMEPGIYVVIPVLENYRCIEISSKTYPLLHDEFITKDNVKVKVETTFTFNVFDAKKAVLNVENYLLALFHLVEITMRCAISSINYEELLYRKERTGNSVLEIVRTACDEWGIKVEKIEIKEITKE